MKMVTLELKGDFRMKKLLKYGIYVFGMIGLLEVTGCGGSVRNDLQNEPQVTDMAQTDAAQTDMVQDEQEVPEEDAESGEKNNRADEKQEITDVPEASVPDVETAVYNQDDFFLSIVIPEGWDYKIRTKEELDKEDGLMLCEIDFWPENYAETVFRFGYMSFFGMCGTGVTIEEYTLENGISGHRYTEEIEDTLWLTVTLKNPDHDINGGTYLIDASPSLSVWESIEPEFEDILASAWVGSIPDEEVAAEE